MVQNEKYSNMIVRIGIFSSLAYGLAICHFVALSE